MKTQPLEVSNKASPATSGTRILSHFTAWICAVFLITSTQAPAGIRSTGGELQGFYQVVTSNDPLFPMDRGKEWFLDFGKGSAAGKNHGSVSISLRQNPNLRIRIFAWQYYPKTATLVIGNPTEPGSNRAVVRANWRLHTDHLGVHLERGQHRIILRPADPAD